MSRESFVEMSNGEQLYFDNIYDALKFAKDQEARCVNSVDLVAITPKETSLDADLTVYQGQSLKSLISGVDDVTSWLNSQREHQHEGRQSEIF